MIVTSQLGLKNGHNMLADTIGHSEAGQSSSSRRIMMIWLLGALILMPVKIFKFPYNMELMDFWIVTGLPVIWFYFILERRPISVPYAFPMWLILVGSLASTLVAPKPSSSIIVIVKEIYIFVWFVTLVALLTRLSARDLRRVLVVWSAMVILHGGLMVAQFLSPDLWRITTHFAGGTETFDHFRAAGLFVDPDKAGNANKAAYFQILGFVPLLLASPSKKIAIILGVLLLSSIFATGSMGGLTALTTGLIFAVIAIAVLSEQFLVVITRIFVLLVIATSLLGGLFYFVTNHNPRYQDHLESIVGGRAEKSSDSRFDLWETGIEVLLNNGSPIWGIGPQNFNVLDKQQRTQLHNDVLAFSVERGLLGVLGLVLFGVTALSRAIYLLLIYSKYPERPRFEVAVFLAAMGATMVESLTHQIFHSSQLWLVLALQEAMLFRMASCRSVGGSGRQRRISAAV